MSSDWSGWRREERASSLLPSTGRRLWDSGLLKSQPFIEEINLQAIMEQAENKLAFPANLRQNQQLSLIKSKFMRIIELQNRNLLERNELHKEHEAILKEQELRARSKADRVKDELRHNGETGRNWRVRNMREGAIVRQRRLQNEWVRMRRDNDELKAKKTFVSDHKSTRIPHAKQADSKADISQRGRLKIDQQYRCGLIREMSLLNTSPASKEAK